MSRRAPALAALLLAPLVVAALLLAACGGGGTDDTAVDPRQLLESAATRMDGVGSFHFALTQQHGTTTIVRGLEMIAAEGDVAGSDRLRLSVKAKAGPLNVQVGIIILPGASYITNPLTGRWEEETISVSSFFDPASGVTALMRSVTDARIAGTETIDGAQIYRVEAHVDSGALALFAAGAPPGRALTARAWIGADDPLVYRIEIEGAATPEEASELLRRLDLSRFGEDLQITAPR